MLSTKWAAVECMTSFIDSDHEKLNNLVYHSIMNSNGNRHQWLQSLLKSAYYYSHIIYIVYIHASVRVHSLYSSHVAKNQQKYPGAINNQQLLGYLHARQLAPPEAQLLFWGCGSPSSCHHIIPQWLEVIA